MDNDTTDKRLEEIRYMVEQSVAYNDIGSLIELALTILLEKGRITEGEYDDAIERIDWQLVVHP